MKWIVLLGCLLTSIEIAAVSMENNVFALQASQIRLKIGKITAIDQVTLRIKPSRAVQLLTPKAQAGLSTPIQINSPIKIKLAQGWLLQGQIQTILLEHGCAILEARALTLTNTNKT
ncbi:MAG: hypothetical protein HRU23_05895 [Gammaproteobacteria bacterium]|nr:hypothetical protein [Gammaproteobacteria bacterium]